jgi:hypothetical protein
MQRIKKTIYHVRYQAENGETAGQRFDDQKLAEKAAAALRRTGHKRVRIVSSRITVLL